MNYKRVGFGDTLIVNTDRIIMPSAHEMITAARVSPLINGKWGHFWPFLHSDQSLDFLLNHTGHFAAQSIPVLSKGGLDLGDSWNQMLREGLKSVLVLSAFKLAARIDVDQCLSDDLAKT